MAKRKRLSPARLDGTPPPPSDAMPTLPRAPLATRPPIADVAQDAATTAAFAEVAQELQNARTQERLIQRLSLDTIVDDYLVRDRAHIDPEELQVLVDSLQKRGQQTAIEVADLGDGRYGLISGFRRLAALRAMALSSPETDTILAIIRHPADGAAAYQAMVEENEIRVGLSFYERGRIVARAVDQGVFRTDRIALGELFGAVPRARKSKIGSFVALVRALDDVLRFPTAITEKQGLLLAKALEEDPHFGQALADTLRRCDPQNASAESDQILNMLALHAATPLFSTGAAQKQPEPVSGKAEKVVSPVHDKADVQVKTDTSQTLQSGLEWSEGPQGQIILRGAKLSDADFRVRLKIALKALK